MSLFEKLINLFNSKSSRLVEQPLCMGNIPDNLETNPQTQLTPLDLPPLSSHEPNYSDLEKRKALKKFHELCTQGLVNEVADDLYVKQIRYSPALRTLTDLQSIFDNSIDEDAMSSMFIGAIRRRDAEMVNYLADEMYSPNSQITNERFIDKCRDLASGNTKPSLTPIN